MKVVILNQYYAPDVASTGHLLYELANDLSINGEDVDVITCRPSYGPPETWQPCPRKERDASGVMVRRMLATRFSKDNMVGRIVNSITFLVPLAARMMFRMKRGEVFLYTTNPPYLGVVGTMVGLVRRHRYVVLLHDAYPQMAVWVGKIRKGGLIDRTWHLLNKWMYRRAKQTIVLCEAAKDLVCDTYGIDPEKVHVIPNWADGEFLHPIDKADSPFAIEHDLVEPLTLLYSGNMGLYYDFDTILNAATLLRGEDVRFVFIGGGGVRSRIEEEIEKRNLDNSMMFPHQPFDTLNESLNACDVSFVTIAKDIEGISFPSKLYTSLAVGKVIIAICEPHSSLRTIVEESGCGMWVELGDADGLVRAVRELAADPEKVRSMGRAARELFERDYTLQACARQYAKVLDKAQRNL
ncbi:MAG: hypothetical protein CMJ24_06310 [Phycisphaerae bacterium]|nr:hypothetical protein [Phycisphaerae bacterium]